MLPTSQIGYTATPVLQPPRSGLKSCFVGHYPSQNSRHGFFTDRLYSLLRQMSFSGLLAFTTISSDHLGSSRYLWIFVLPASSCIISCLCRFTCQQNSAGARPPYRLHVFSSSLRPQIVQPVLLVYALRAEKSQCSALLVHEWKFAVLLFSPPDDALAAAAVAGCPRETSSAREAQGHDLPRLNSPVFRNTLCLSRAAIWLVACFGSGSVGKGRALLARARLVADQNVVPSDVAAAATILRLASQIFADSARHLPTPVKPALVSV